MFVFRPVCLSFRHTVGPHEGMTTVTSRETNDFDRFDLIIGMDDMNIENLRRLAPDADAWTKIHRMTDYSRRYAHDHVPDPYYSGADGFELVLDLLEDACDGLLDHLAGTDE